MVVVEVDSEVCLISKFPLYPCLDIPATRISGRKYGGLPSRVPCSYVIQVVRAEVEDVEDTNNEILDLPMSSKVRAKPTNAIILPCRLMLTPLPL